LWFLVFSFTIHSGGFFKPVSGVWDAEGGVEKLVQKALHCTVMK
jgi:hypothetical protein